MKLEMFWDSSGGSLHPDCACDTESLPGASPLACLLSDDGGTGYLNSIAWLDEGLRQVHLVKRLEKSTAVWDRESWGANIELDGVTIYSLYDEDFSETVSFASFEDALTAWRLFLSKSPDYKAKQYVDVFPVKRS